MTPVRRVVIWQANVILQVQHLAAGISAVFPVRFVVLQVIAAARTPATIQLQYVVVRLPAVLPVSLVVVIVLEISAANLDFVILMAVTAVHLNVQNLVQVSQGILSVLGLIPSVAKTISAQVVFSVVVTGCAVQQVQIVMIVDV
jgi:hypothetical protein